MLTTQKEWSRLKLNFLSVSIYIVHWLWLQSLWDQQFLYPRIHSAQSFLVVFEGKAEDTQDEFDSCQVWLLCRRGELGYVAVLDVRGGLQSLSGCLLLAACSNLKGEAAAFSRHNYPPGWTIRRSNNRLLLSLCTRDCWILKCFERATCQLTLMTRQTLPSGC